MFVRPSEGILGHDLQLVNDYFLAAEHFQEPSERTLRRTVGQQRFRGLSAWRLAAEF